MVEILGGLLAGSRTTVDQPGNGLGFLVVDIAAFQAPDHFAALIEELREYIKSSPPSESSDEVTLPGELDFKLGERRLREGIPIDDQTWNQIVKAAESVGGKLADARFETSAGAFRFDTGPSLLTWPAVVPFTVGKEFDVVLVSFDHRDTPEAANAKKRAHLQHWAVPETADGWHFLTGSEPEIQRVTSAAGFTYQWDEESQQFAHVSGVLVVTPDGRLSRYFYGVEFSPKDLRLALVDSGQGRLGSVVEELLLYCFHYDPSTGKYGAAFMNIMRLGAVLTVGLILGFVVLMRWRESRHVAERHA